MRKIDNRQYKLTQIRRPKLGVKPTDSRSDVKNKKGRRGDSRLDRRGMK
ncbi:MAG: hypothetical protein JSW66_10910 [Phycisphaerales bacterium]|nr:MAG: hypothetical protein JSW66_10910 [Phycisphaerales bacterium]